MNSLIRPIAAAALVFGLCTAVFAEDLESVEKQIAAAWAKHKSMTAKMTSESHFEMGDMKVESKAEGTLETAREGDKQFLRMEMKTTMTRKSGDQESRMEQNTSIVADGEFAYTTTDNAGQTIVMKTKIDPLMTGEPKGLLDQLRKEYELKLLPDDTVGGRKTWVIQATPQKEDVPPGMPSRFVLHFDQEHGVLIKHGSVTADGKPVSTTTYSDLKFDVKVDPERFKFKKPEGAQIIDRTGKPE
jgi:outer membrane lipoprotein-sorting protein